MKRYKILHGFLLACFLLLFFGGNSQTILNAPKQVIISGKVIHYNPDLPLKIYVNRLGFSSSEITARTDSAGNFYVTFESYIPTDAWITYKSNFLVLVYPGDSLHVEFDGRSDQRQEILSAVRYGGNHAETNRCASAFQMMCYSDLVYTDYRRKKQAIKEYEPDRYSLYLDTLKSHFDSLYNAFTARYHPDERSRRWAQLFIGQEYYDNLAFYPMDHREANNMALSNSWDVPKGFFQRLANRLPIDTGMLVSGYSLVRFADRFKKYLADQMKDNLPENSAVAAGIWFLPVEIGDSVILHSTIKCVSDTLLRQIMLTSYFSAQLEKQQIAGYQKFGRIINDFIKLPFLKEPLRELYLQTKARIEHPEVYTEAVLKEAGSSSVAQLLDSIFHNNKNKIIYIDVWATWCGPCLAEFPNSKLVEQQMKGREVAFVYLCTASEKDQWKAILDKYQLGGQHYFLLPRQSTELTRTFEIKGIPFYILIDKKGIIREKGNQLRPLDARDKVLELL